MRAKVEYSVDYELLWLDGASDRIGEVRNPTADGTRYRVVPIRNGDAELATAGMRLAALTYDKSGNPVIQVGNAFRAMPPVVQGASIWHEMGHVHFEHVLSDQHASQAERRAARIAAIDAGSVDSNEIEADRFAVVHAGQHAVLALLNLTLTTRPTGGALGWNDAGRRELERRIAAVREIGRNSPCPCGSGKKYKNCCLK